MPDDLVIGKGRTANFTAIATGISTVENNFVLQWQKRDSDSLSDKVSGVNGSVLSIPNVLESDGGSYYCIVTNEWGRMKMSDDVTLSIFGMFSISFITQCTKHLSTVQHKILTGENIDEFDEFLAICQYFPYQNFPFI